MSFSQDTREELIKLFCKAEHARKAELAAIFVMGSRGLSRDAGSGKYIYEDPRASAETGTEPLRKVFNIDGELDLKGPLKPLIKKPDDKRAFLRGAFIVGGTISDPSKDNHFEITVPDKGTAGLLKDLFADFDVELKEMNRRGKWVVYLKDGEMIAQALNVIQAHNALMKFENARIEREIRGVVNRKFNCDTANINKAVTASMKQTEDIRLIDSVMGLSELEPGLRDICQVRLANPDMSLEEVGAACTPPVGKSGANHRFRKIAEMAAQLRGSK